MARVTIRFNDALYERLVAGARASDTNVADYVRSVLDRYEGMDAGGYHGRFDELLSTNIQTFAIVAAYVSGLHPDLLARGVADARKHLLERGLIDPVEERS
ncbi:MULTISPECIES: hypothetical protein [Sphingobium]|uniref:CopG family transcriptional regulator n=1 Tax=Sphingobium limneticum TaxID=1007511 RepID=A0A5J5HVG7_9SPHN|nr:MULTISPECIES: hypothetical protein [Sphingobium]KAA9011648.1 hypothetical protein F4U94_20280 [Sphingobium limneticum]KAA9012268.1 hypothetical protein F4U96_21485 [Sphingobium limneticum]KAA9024729.1 hypothetical protein F4U95_21600 [Sphingobium limneticum]BBD03363.1 RHH-type transcriptional regulator, rel operon repressor/antitoxin RelB [Sphingobium sp. YG1]